MAWPINFQGASFFPDLVGAELCLAELSLLAQSTSLVKNSKRILDKGGDPKMGEEVVA